MEFVFQVYSKKMCGEVIVVFDGYNRVSTKSMTQQWRAAGKVGSTVTSANMEVTLKKEEFLFNSRNKQRLINLLRQVLQKNYVTHHADGDDYLLIVKTAVESARKRTTVLVGDDTDLLVLLCPYTSLDDHDLYFQPEPKANLRHWVWDMKVVKAKLGESICDNILILHAILGSDTTSRLYGIGKGTAIKKYDTCQHFREQAKLFHSSSTVDDVVAAGENVLVSLYNGKPGD